MYSHCMLSIYLPSRYRLPLLGTVLDSSHRSTPRSPHPMSLPQKRPSDGDGSACDDDVVDDNDDDDDDGSGYIMVIARTRMHHDTTVR